jgi:hypothetical protein
MKEIAKNCKHYSKCKSTTFLDLTTNTLQPYPFDCHFCERFELADHTECEHEFVRTLIGTAKYRTLYKRRRGEKEVWGSGVIVELCTKCGFFPFVEKIDPDVQKKRKGSMYAKRHMYSKFRG